MEACGNRDLSASQPRVGEAHDIRFEDRVPSRRAEPGQYLQVFSTDKGLNLFRWILFVAGILGAIGVAVGAHAAHGLELSLLEQGVAPEEVVKRLDQCDVAVRYHMTHVLALFVLGGFVGESAPRRKMIAACFLLLGIAFFSGGLYSMVYVGKMGHWAIVPAGGLCFILGWLTIATLAWDTGEES